MGLIPHNLHRLKEETSSLPGGGWVFGVVGAASSTACVGGSRWGRGPTRRATGRRGLPLTLIRVNHTSTSSRAVVGWFTLFPMIGGSFYAVSCTGLA